MNEVKVTVIRDGRSLVYTFTAKELPEGFKAFGWGYTNYKGEQQVSMKGRNGDKMPCLVAEDWLRDHGMEPVRIGWRGWGC